MKYRIVFAIIFLVLPVVVAAQVDTVWVRRYDGPGNEYDGAEVLALDSAGNVYVTGNSCGITGMQDFCTIKYYPNGDTAWVRRYNGSGNSSDDVCDIAIDTSGNVYITGYVIGAGTNVDWATIKYYPNGDTAWIRVYHRMSLSQDQAYALAIDHQGNVVATGFSYVVPAYNSDMTTIKYKANGDTAWLRFYDDTNDASDDASDVAVDSAGYVYVTGNSYNPGTYADYTTIKYNPDGDTVWIRKYDGPSHSSDGAYVIAVDESGNVYVTGASTGANGYNDYATIKYYANGDTAWVRRYDTPEGWDDQPEAMVIDDSGNVYVTGFTMDDMYMYCDYLTVKYYANGDTAWVRRYDGPSNGMDEAHDIAVDTSGNVYVTGKSDGAGTSADFATIKYDVNGDTIWTLRYNGPSNDFDRATSILVDNLGYVYVAGLSYDPTSFYDYVTIKYGQNIGIEESNKHYTFTKSKIQIFPNPAHGYFTIYFPHGVEYHKLKIFDVTGALIKEIDHRKSETEYSVSLDGMKAGIYFVQKGKEPSVTKLIVIK